MKFAYPVLAFLLSLLFFLPSGYGQAHQSHRSTSPSLHDAMPGPFRLGAVVGYVIVPTATSSGREHLVLPSLGLDLEYWFSGTWGLGLHNDMELVIFEVETEQDLFVEREYPLLLTLDVLWKPWKGLVLFGGPGIELERSEHYWVGRFGLEYEIPIGHHWDLFPAAFYDYRRGAYDTYSIGLGVGKRF